MTHPNQLPAEVLKRADSLALSTCLHSWSAADSFETVLSKIGENGSVVERPEYLNAKPEKLANIIRAHQEALIEFAQLTLSTSQAA